MAVSWCREYINRVAQCRFAQLKSPLLEKQMAWVFAQVFLAFALAVFIVWWTFPKKKKPKPPSERDADVSSDQNA